MFTWASLMAICLLALAVEGGRPKRAAVGPVWPTRKIAYQFAFEYDMTARLQVQATLKQIEKVLEVDGEKCLEFHERDEDKDYILFRNIGNRECSSGIGYFPGINRVSLGYDCLEQGTVMHEIMHRLVRLELQFLSLRS